MHTEDFKLITHGEKSMEFLRGGLGANSSTFDSRFSLEGNFYNNNAENKQSKMIPSMKMESVNFANKPGSAENKSKDVKNSLKNSNIQNSFQLDSGLQKTYQSMEYSLHKADESNLKDLSYTISSRMIKQGQGTLSLAKGTLNFDKTTKTDYLPSIQSSQMDSRLYEPSSIMGDSLKDSLRNGHPKTMNSKKQTFENKIEIVENPFYKDTKPTNQLKGNKLMIPLSNFTSTKKEVIPMYRKVKLPSLSSQMAGSSGKKKKSELNESLEDSLGEEDFEPDFDDAKNDFSSPENKNRIAPHLMTMKTINSLDLSAARSNVSPIHRQPSFMNGPDAFSDDGEDSINVRGEDDDGMEEVRSELQVSNTTFNDKSSLNDRASMSNLEVSGLSNLKKSFKSIEYAGKLKKLKLLGSGGEAKVYLCEATEFKQMVALKEFMHVESEFEKMYANLRAQFGLLKSMDHENIINYFSLYKPKLPPGQNFIEFGIIMEYLPGGSLEKLITDDYKSLDDSDKKRLMYQMLIAVDYLHQHKVIHRDLKPDNVLLSEDKKLVKLCDFGISVITKNNTTVERSMVGTPWYMAPEVISQEAYSSKADIWSLGCCFLHIVTGKKPYSNQNGIQALMKIVTDSNPLLSYSDEEIEKIRKYNGLEDVFEMCFLKDQKLRATSQELLETPFFAHIF